MKRQVLAAVVTGSLGLLVLSGCGAAADAAPAPSASTSAKAKVPHRRARTRARYLRRHAVHGQVTVHTKKGYRTVVVQRGQITALDGDHLTVKSPDGYRLTWTLTGRTHVRADGKKADRSALKTSERIGVLGTRSGDTTTARAVRVRKS